MQRTQNQDEVLAAVAQIGSGKLPGMGLIFEKKENSNAPPEFENVELSVFLAMRGGDYDFKVPMSVAAHGLIELVREVFQGDVDQISNFAHMLVISTIVSRSINPPVDPENAQ